MRIVTACLCVLGLTMAANSQEKGARVAEPPAAAILKARQMEVPWQPGGRSGLPRAARPGR